MNDSSSAESEGLVRAIGTRALGLNIINMVVGGGIFVLPGLIAVQLGSAAIVAFFICSIAVALVFLCFAEIAAIRGSDPDTTLMALLQADAVIGGTVTGNRPSKPIRRASP